MSSASARTATELSGLDYLRGMIAGEFETAPMADLLGFRLVSVDSGECAFEAEPGEQHLNPLNTVHGGLAMTMLDSACGCAVHTTLIPGQLYTTLETKVNLLRPIFPGTGTIVAEGKVLNRGKRTAMSEGQLRGADGKLLAHATSTCVILGGD